MTRLAKVFLFLSATLVPSSVYSADAETQKAIQASWERCMDVYAITVAGKTDERAEVIADAALTSCQDEENKLFELYSENAPPLKAFLLEELLPAQRDDYRRKTIAKILTYRASE